MAHEIEIDENGRASFFSGEGKAAWHGLGTIIDGLATAKEALELANLDWTVSLEPVSFVGPNSGARIIVPDRFAATRSTDEKPLGIVGGDYNVVNNVEAFSFFDTVVDSGEAKYSTAGSLQGGSKVFMTAKVGDTFTVGDDDEIENYLAISTSHDGTKAFTAFTTTIRVVCANTLTLGLASAANKWSITHRQSLTGKAEEARKALNISFKYQEAFEAEVERLLAVEVEKDQFKAIIESILPDQKRKKERSVNELMDVFENEPTVKAGGAEGTGWGALNAVTYWTDWKKEFRNAEARTKSLTGGPVAALRNTARDRILALA